MAELYDTIDKLPQTSTQTIKRFAHLGINTYLDLLNFFPLRYKDTRTVLPIISITQSAEKACMLSKYSYNNNDDYSQLPLQTVRGHVKTFTSTRTRRNISIQTATVIDKTGSIQAVWFQQPYLSQLITKNTQIQLTGRVRTFANRPSISVEDFDLLSSNREILHTGRLVPVYSQKVATSRTIREKIFIALQQTLPNIEDILPDEICKKYSLLSEKDAYNKIHFPLSINEIDKAKERLGFDELFLIQLSSLIVRREWKKDKIGSLCDTSKYKSTIQAYMRSFGFSLTSAQKRSADEILIDMSKTTPMNRLLQGDVGSGKTVVASIAIASAYLNGYRSLLMAPTEILARQHYQTLAKLFSSDSIAPQPNISLITQSQKPDKSMLQKSDILVGTHALINKQRTFDPKTIALVIIDEQHKFGVRQRAMLKEKGAQPHLLTMTATPIPRTVCLTLYGELDISIIDELPPGRMKTKTHIVPKKKRDSAYKWMYQQVVKNNTQAFIICPLIDESDNETMVSVRAVRAEFETLKAKYFSTLRLGLLHGKLPSAEKERIMKKFSMHEIDILVSTPLVEVGIDIPNATIIAIETAERFGLAQLHQLRGRVGRSTSQAYCLLFTEKDDALISDRLSIFSRTNSGFALAEYDLKRRGGGELFGTKQHGYTDLKIASLSDSQLVHRTNATANEFASGSYPQFHSKVLNTRLDILTTARIARD